MALFFIALILAGAGLFMLGRRGRAIGHHPFCRICGFNLHALPRDHARCPECGADISLADAIHVGYRKPSYWVMALGLLLGVIGGISLAPPVMNWWTTFDGSPYKPAAWLQLDVNAPNETQRLAACRELKRRLQAGALSAATVDHLAEVLLKLQANPIVTWNSYWGDLIQAGHSTRKLSPALWQRYLAQAMQITARVRPRVRIDDPIPIALSCQLRAGTDYMAMVPASLTPDITATLGKLTGPVRARAVQIDTVPIPINWSALWMPSLREGVARTQWPADAGGLDPGPQLLKLSVTMTFHDVDKNSASVVKTLSLPLQLLARAQPSVELLQPVAMEPDMQQAIRLRRPAGLSTASDGSLAISSTGGPLGSLWISGPPMGAAFRVVLRQDAHDWSLARFLVRPSDAASVPLQLDISPLDQGPHAGPAEIVCLPDPSLATGTADILEVWAGEIHRPLVLSIPEN